MRVLQLISSGGMYGAEAVILNLARSLDAGGHRSVLGVFSNSAGGDVQLHREALAQNLESHLLPCAGQFDRRMFAQLRALVREHRIDIVHAHGYKADVYAFLALRRVGVPLVSTCHTWLDTDLKVKVYGVLDRLILRRFAAVAVVSEELRRMLLQIGFPADRLHLVLNGIDITPFQQAAALAPPPGPAPRIGLIGRLSHEKGIDLFLEAAALVHPQFPEARFLIAGAGPRRADLEDLTAQLGLTHCVQFLGRSDTMPELLASLDLVVSASRQEGLPMTLLQAMASGRPIIATTVGEVPTVLDGGKAGMLVPPENIPALANAILTLLRDPDLRRTYATEAAQRVAALFSADRMTAHYLTMYTAAITPGRPAETAPD